jgi:ribosomal protein L40E
MSLRICPDCRASISSSAYKCPRCGRDMQRYKWFFLSVCVILILLLVTAMHIGGLF